VWLGSEAITSLMRAAAPILVVGSSGRIAAQALSRAGYTIDVFDCFGDADTRQAARHIKVVTPVPDAPYLPAHRALIPLIQEWKGLNPSGWVLSTAGFEASPDTLEYLDSLDTYLGNSAQSVQRVKDPWEFARICQGQGFATPKILPLPPLNQNPPQQWLKKTIGGSGGTHIHAVTHEEAIQLQAPYYAQEHMEGDALSVLFLSGPAITHVLSCHRQYLAPGSDCPYRFGGLVVAADIPERAIALLTRACTQLSQHFGLMGLNGLDAIWDGKELWILEINPRPPASLSLYPNALLAQLFEAHLSYCSSNMPTHRFSRHLNSNVSGVTEQTLPSVDDISRSMFDHHNLLNRGMAIVYAIELLSIPADFRFPSSCHDLPILPRTFEAGEPICSVVAEDGGLGKLRAHMNALRECLNPVAGVDLLSSL
jgi:predicted ATP-grasp superfamily ATP-dependent carboligase